MITLIKQSIKDHHRILLVSIVVGFFLPLIKKNLNLYLTSTSTVTTANLNPNGERIFTLTELSEYNGADNSKGLFIAIMGTKGLQRRSLMGTVYDVEKGRKHYGPGNSYNFFAGRDASTSFISGEFETITPNLDHVLSMKPKEILSLSEWKKFYDKDYIYKGKLIGRFYDSKGDRTEYFGKVEEQIKIALEEKAKDEQHQKDFPGCNIEWNADTGTKVWCTSQSGGVERSWIGVPRKYFELGTTSFRCVCVDGELLSSPNIKEYDNCDSESTFCYYQLDE